MLYSVCLLPEKKSSATRVLIHDCMFFPNLHISKKFHVPAIFPKFHASSCSQTKVKVWGGGGVLPLPTQKRGSKSPPGIGLRAFIQIQTVTQF